MKKKVSTEREMRMLSSQMRQSIRTRLVASINNLAKLKRKGYKVGRLNQRKLSRCESHSKNWHKAREHLDKSIEKDNNQKHDVKNKVVSYLDHNFNHTAVQNDSIKGWQCLFGKAVHNSAIGKILCELKKRPRTLLVPRFFPSTKRCRIPTCHNIMDDMTLADRTFVCSKCGHTEDRDVHSARNILLEAVPGGPRDFKPVENETSAMVEYFSNIGKFCSVNQEANFGRKPKND